MIRVIWTLISDSLLEYFRKAKVCKIGPNFFLCEDALVSQQRTRHVWELRTTYIGNIFSKSSSQYTARLWSEKTKWQWQYHRKSLQSVLATTSPPAIPALRHAAIPDTARLLPEGAALTHISVFAPPGPWEISALAGHPASFLWAPAHPHYCVHISPPGVWASLRAETSSFHLCSPDNLHTVDAGKYFMNEWDVSPALIKSKGRNHL